MRTAARDAQSMPAAEQVEGRARYGRWRAASLVLVYLLMLGHYVHWRLAGTTLAPVELNEVMYTLEAGIITAGFVFMAIAAVTVLIFGRFFCSWGCHILALEDLCAWLLKRAGIRPRPIRSRALLLVPPAALFYMFVWPQVTRLAAGRPAPEWRIMAPDDLWGSWLTTDFTRNLPGPVIALITLFVCGFLIVYLLGSRSFCQYVCPYGAAFALADRLSPGRIVRVGGSCDKCGVCTAVCKSNILVHHEISVFGKVVSPACLKDLDCVAACPDQSLRWGFAAPAMFQSLSGANRRARRYDLSWAEDGLVVIIFIASVLALRGLYDAVPFLLALAMATVLAWLAVVTWRLARRSRVDLPGVPLRSRDRFMPAGRAFAIIAVAAGGLVVHSGFIRWHEWRGQAAFEQLRQATMQRDAQQAQRAAAKAIAHLDVCDRFGLVQSSQLLQRLASASEWSARPLDAEPYLRRLISRRPDDVEPRLRLVSLLLLADRLNEAVEATSALDRAAARVAALTHDDANLRRAEGLKAALARRLEQNAPAPADR